MMIRKIKSAATTALMLLIAQNAAATEVSTNTAIMQAMDKITGQVDLIEVPVNHEVTFGTFSIVVRECKTRTPEETPENFAFVDVVDSTTRDGNVNIFKGWMLSSSPALNPVAHPVYDVWLIKCVDRKVDKGLELTPEGLAARDNITMNRQLEKLSVTAEDSDMSEDRTPGEPVNLIPQDIAISAVEEDLQNENANEKDETTAKSEASDDVTSPAQPSPAPLEDKVDGVPQALVVIEEPEVTVEPAAPVQEADYETIEELPTDTGATEQSEAVSEKDNNDKTDAPATDDDKDLISAIEKELSQQAITE